MIGGVAAASGDGAHSRAASAISGGVSAGGVVADTNLEDDRVLQASRALSASRESLTKPVVQAAASGQVRQIKPKVVDHEYTTAGLNVWTGPGERFTFLSVLPRGSKVDVTKYDNGPWAQIVQDGKARWVQGAYLSEQKPKPEPEPESVEEGSSGTESVGGLSSAPCSSGSAVEAGLTPDAIAVHRAACAAFPEISGFGGVRYDGFHGEGRALDMMISGSSGDAIAEWARANSSALGVSEVLWAQHIWTVQRSSEGWRSMSDRGSPTANHMDHVHVSVYGSSGTA